MVVKRVNIAILEEYVYNAFLDDDELVALYDKAANVKTPIEASGNVMEKIRHVYPESDMYGVEVNLVKAGYFVCKNNLLISFGMMKEYRRKDILHRFWDEIQQRMGDSFECALYSSNTRGCEWLVKCGMTEIFREISIFSYQK